MKNVIINYIFNDKDLILKSEEDKISLKIFKLGLSEGDEVEVFFIVKDSPNKSTAQLKKVHAMIRDLAMETGETFSKVKNDIKYLTGLYENLETGIKYKSFKHCTKEEIEMVITKLYEISSEMGFQLF